jgi:SAM-dependent methyltransferase
MADVPYETWADYVDDTLTKFHARGRRLLDLACGTGTLALLLASRGYLVTAVDGSRDMLQQLRAKLAGHRPAPAVSPVRATLAGFAAPTVHDCAVCFFDSINYVVDPAELRRSFANVARYLRPGGLLAFDVNTATAFESRAFDRDGEVTCGDARLQFRFSGSYDRRSRIASMRLAFRDAAGRAVFEEFHTQRAYQRGQIEDLLRRTAFTTEGFFRAFSFEPARETDDRWIFVCRKE